MEILKTIGITKNYKENKALNDVNMTINKGDIYGFIGKNGAGKTTLIKLILGLSSPTSGQITLFEDNNLNMWRKKIGCIIESPAFIPHLSAKSNLYLQFILFGKKDTKEIDDLLEFVGLGNVGNKKAKNFSLGMKQRLGIAMALAGDPEFLVLDEPVNGLDPEGIIEVRDLLLKLNKEKNVTILISSHLLTELSKIATRYGIINNGNLIDEFSKEELDQRVSSSLIIKTKDIENAEQILKENFKDLDYKIVDNTTIKILNHLELASKINLALSKNNISIDSFSIDKTDLEDYFIKKIGGKEID